MKVHVADIVVPDYDLMKDIVHALENCPQSGHSYEVEMRENRAIDHRNERPTDRAEWGLRIFRQAIV